MDTQDSTKVDAIAITNSHLAPRAHEAIECYVVERSLLGAKHRIETLVFGNGHAWQAWGDAEPDAGRWNSERMTIDLGHGVLDLAGRTTYSAEEA